MKIIFIGSVIFSKEILEHLIKKKIKVSLIVTKKIDVRKSDKIDLKKVARKNKIPYLYAKNINDEKNIKIIKSFKPDVIFCFGWSEILKKKDIKNFKDGNSRISSFRLTIQ